MTSSVLVGPDWLEAHLDDPDIRIVDASWYLAAAGRDGRAEYTADHLPGAIYLDLSTDLADPDAPVRNSVAAVGRLAEVLGRCGIAPEHRVVVYDRLGGYSAGRVWWTLRYAGCSRASLLDGGYPRWVAEGRPTDAQPASHPARHFEARARPELWRDKADVLRIVREGGAQLVDARSPARFEGVGEEPARHRGHMPGAINVPVDRHWSGDPPRILSPAALRALYEGAGVDLSAPVVTTCGSGVTAAMNAFALCLLGCPDVAVYDGSWAEWGNADDVPIDPPPDASRA